MDGGAGLAVKPVASTINHQPTSGGTGSLATAYGVWEKEGEYYVYSRSGSLFEGGLR